MGSLSLTDSTIVAAVVSAVVSFSILVISNFVIQPRRWKQNIRVHNLEKRLEVYGALLTFLKSLRDKNERQPHPGLKEEYMMENPYDYKRMVGFFERYNYLLSNEISQLWLEFIKSDKYFGLFSSLSKPSTLNFDLSKMEELVEKEYGELKSQYQNLTGIKF